MAYADVVRWVRANKYTFSIDKTESLDVAEDMLNFVNRKNVQKGKEKLHFRIGQKSQFIGNIANEVEGTLEFREITRIKNVLEEGVPRIIEREAEKYEELSPQQRGAITRRLIREVREETKKEGNAQEIERFAKARAVGELEKERYESGETKTR